MREGQRVTDLLENHHQLAQRIPLQRRGALQPQAGEHPRERLAAHELHHVVRLVEFVHIHLIHGDDIRVLKLRGHLRFLDETRHVFRRVHIEQHLHRHAPPRREILRLQHRAHPTHGDEPMHLVFSLPSQFRRQVAVQRGGLRRERFLCIVETQTPQPQLHIAHFHLLAGKNHRRLRRLPPAHARPVRAAEILDEPVEITQHKPRMTPRHFLGTHPDRHLPLASDEVFPRRQHRAENLPSVAQGDDFSLGGDHAVTELLEAASGGCP